MYKLGEYNTLTVSHDVQFGIYLRDDEDNKILLPRKYVPQGLKEGDALKVFIYTDSEDRPVATTQTPKGTVGDIVALEVIDSNELGAFLDWGLEKDLLLPFKHQNKTKRPRRGSQVVVKILYDEVSERLIATTRFMTAYDPNKGRLRIGDKVKLHICDPHERGFTVLIDEKFKGLLFQSDIHEQLQPGDRRNGYIKNIRPDGKIDVALKPAGFSAVIDQDKEKVMSLLQAAADSALPYNAKSSPEDIKRVFGLSKKSFKNAIGGLYKERRITITDTGIELTPQ